MLLKPGLHWTAHVIRIEDLRIPKQLLFGELEQGHRKQGCPCKHFKDTVKVGLKWCNIPQTKLVANALDRQCWHTHTICVIFTRGRAPPPSSVHQRMLPLSTFCPSDNCELPVPVYAWLCKSKMGLRGHCRIHKGTDNVILKTEGPPLLTDRAKIRKHP